MINITAHDVDQIKIDIHIKFYALNFQFTIEFICIKKNTKTSYRFSSEIDKRPRYLRIPRKLVLSVYVIFGR